MGFSFLKSWELAYKLFKSLCWTHPLGEKDGWENMAKARMLMMFIIRLCISVMWKQRLNSRNTHPWELHGREICMMFIKSFPEFEELLFYKELKSKELWHLSVEVTKARETTAQLLGRGIRSSRSPSKRGGACSHECSGSWHRDRRPGAQMVPGVYGGQGGISPEQFKEKSLPVFYSVILSLAQWIWSQWWGVSAHGQRPNPTNNCCLRLPDKSERRPACATALSPRMLSYTKAESPDDS